jgi:hypothetical protein
VERASEKSTVDAATNERIIRLEMMDMFVGG